MEVDFGDWAKKGQKVEIELEKKVIILRIIIIIIIKVIDNREYINEDGYKNCASAAD